MATPPGGAHASFVNDRFYLHNTSGYLALGHEEPSNMPPHAMGGADNSKQLQKDAK